MKKMWPPEWLVSAKDKPNTLFGVEPEPGVVGCPNCGGDTLVYGFFVRAGPFNFAPVGDHVHFVEGLGYFIGEYKSAPCPVCAGGRRDDYLAQICGLKGPDLAVRFSDFKPLPGKEFAQGVAAALLGLCPAPHGFVTFHGGYGVGKTLLLLGLVNGFRIARVPAVYLVAADMLASVRELFDAQHAAEKLLVEYKNIPVLAIDEIDKVNLTPWAAETIYRLMDGRYRAEKYRLTLLAMNCSPEKLAEKDERMGYLTSRMTAGVIVEIGGVDVRPALGARKEQALVPAWEDV